MPIDDNILLGHEILARFVTNTSPATGNIRILVHTLAYS